MKSLYAAPSGRLASGISLVAVLFLAAAAIAGPPPIDNLSDEFDNPATLATDWTRLKDAESWPNEQLETLDIATSRTGWMTIVPRTCTWYEDYRGPLVFKEVTGDFVATASVEATNRAGTGAPGRQFSLGGIFTRAPRAITPGTWMIGGEKYTFLSIGSAGNPGTFQMEVKTTGDFDGDPQSDSILEYAATGCACGEAIIQTARIGEYIIQLRQEAGDVWVVHRRYHRADFPATMQVGLCTYTDWTVASTYNFFDQNTTEITHAFGDPGTPAQPDLRFQADYFRLTRPVVPPGLVGVDLTDEMLVPDGDLLAFLGDNANNEPADVARWKLY